MTGCFFDLFLFLVLAVILVRPFWQAMLLAFLSGLILDLGTGSFLGFASLVYLIGAETLSIYRRRFSPAHPFFLPIFAFLIDIVAGRIYFGVWRAYPALAVAAGAVLIRPVIVYLVKGREKKLKAV